MRSFWSGLLIAIIVTTAWFGLWFGWGRFKAGPPEAVVQDFLRAAQSGDWGTAQAYMTRHMRGRIAQEGFGGMQRFLEARLNPFTTFEIVRVLPRNTDDVDVVARLLFPIPGGGVGRPAASKPGDHDAPGRVEGSSYVHAHRFELQREGRAWRIYQFEEVDERS